METDEQHDAGIHQPIGEGGIATPEQVPVGQRVVEIPGDQYGVVRLRRVGHHPDRFDHGQVIVTEAAQHPVLGLGCGDRRRLECVDPLVEAHEAHDVTADAVRHLHETRMVPFGQRHIPRQIEEVGMSLLRHDLHAATSP